MEKREMMPLIISIGGVQMRRREVIAGLGGAAAWPLMARS
jgi:hypothetical protein